MNKESKIIFSIALVVIIGMIALIGLGPKESRSIDISLLANTTSHMTGKIGAEVTVVEFGDYQCPACGVAYPRLKQVIDVYGGNPDFNFVFRNFPLSQHRNALIAAEAAEAASAQGKYWEMEGLLYMNQNEWSDNSAPIDIFIKYAQKLGLNTTKFRSEIVSEKYRAFIEADQADGSALNVSWTPTIYINGELQQQTPTFEQFKSKIDTLLKK
jgi:protein-disulfide isomerase